MDAFARRDSLTEWSSLLSRASPGAQAWTRSLGVRLPSSARPGPPPACQGNRPPPPSELAQVLSWGAGSQHLWWGSPSKAAGAIPVLRLATGGALAGSEG